MIFRLNAAALLAVSLAALIGLSSSSLTAQEIPWKADIAEARTAAASSQKLVWLHFGATWCQPCLSLETFVFKNPAMVRAASTEVVPCKIDFDASPELIEQYRVDSLPFDVLLAPNGDVIASRKSPSAVEEFVAMFQDANKTYRAIQSGGEDVWQARKDLQETLDANHRAAVGLTEDTQSFQNSRTAFANDAESPQQIANSLRTSQREQQRVVNPYVNQTANGTSQGQTGQIGQTSGIMASAPGRVETGNELSPVANKAASEGESEPFALSGDCPVTLILENRWVPGDIRFGCQHRGRTYLFSSQAYLDKFWTAPDRYSPLLAGYDPVIYHESGLLIAGDKSNGVFMHIDGIQQIVLFKDEATRAKFQQSPTVYLQAVQEAVRKADASNNANR